MRKIKKTDELQERRPTSRLLAISLAASLAAFGCTTNHTLGNGTPTRSGPELRSSPTSGVTIGGESTTPPMTSSSTSPEGPAGSMRKAGEAAAIMAQHQRRRAVYLGVVNPGSSQSAGRAGGAAGQLVSPSAQLKPHLTVNSSFTPGTPVITSGAGVADTGAALFVPGTSTAVIEGTTAAATVTGTAAATATTPTAAAIPLSPGTFAAAAPAPPAAAAAVPTVTGASAGAGLSRSTATAPVRLVRDTNGATITNVGTSTSSTAGRSQ